MMIWWLLFPVVMFESAWHRPCLVFAQERDDHECNSYGVCLPGAEDVAVSPRTVTASNTCGDPPGRYCQKGPPSSCFVCNSSSNTNRHPVDFMIDRDRGRRYGTSNLTSWWQSQTWWEWLDIHKEDPLVVNITLSFNKTYVITGDIRINFRSPKPLKMVIEKSADFGNTWIQLQYFADKCSSRFNMRSSALNCSTDTVLCTERYSDPKPGPVYFSFLNCYTKENFWEKEIQNLINATDLRLRLEYPGTDGLETIKTEERLNRYFYAISDIQVFGRCQCNGHARNCEFPTKILNGKSVYVNEPKCMCEHHTTGVDCEKCEPLYNNKTWMPATSTTQANPCEKCECNEHASSCTFNSSLGHGVCDKCQDNTTGYFCEQCEDKFYRNLTKHLNDSNVCLECDCAVEGITNNGSCSQDVATIGQCMCKDNVTGRQCDRCNDTYYGYMLPPAGSCIECHCNMYGTVNGDLNCHQETGQCTCKPNIHLRTCSECKIGFYNFPNSTGADCLECHCDDGGSTEQICENTRGKCLCRNGVRGEACSNVTDNRFFPKLDYLLYEAEYQSGNYSLTSDLGAYGKYFTGRGYARITRKQYIDFTILVDVDSNYSLVLRYSNALGNVAVHVRGGNSSSCSAINRNISTSNLLPRGQGMSWRSHERFVLCSNNTYAIRLQGNDPAENFSIDIDSLVLVPQLTELRAYKNMSKLVNTCQTNFSTIQGGYASSSACRSITFSTMIELYNGSLACDCSEIGAESETCDAYGGQCRCKPGVMGIRCDKCRPGYFNFTNEGCTPCNCDDLGSKNFSVCDHTSGQCVCKRAVEGRTCGRCEMNFFGLNTGKGCIPCNCNATGAKNASCDGVTGKCYCKFGVEEKETDKCDRCKANYFNFTKTGCQACNCDKAGSRSLQCHSSGECPCKINTSGKKCSQCISGTFALERSNPSGCTPCFCFNRTRQCSSAEGFILTSIEQSNLTLVSNNYVHLTSSFSGNQLRSYGRLFIVYMSTASNFSGDFDLHLKSPRRDITFRLSSTPEKDRYYVLLHENNTRERLTTYEMQSILVDLREVTLNATYESEYERVNITITKVSMGSAIPGVGSINDKAKHVENCSCPYSYTTLSCENCNTGFTREVANSSSFVNCHPCPCNNRSETCDPETRICSNCRLSAGPFCEKCQYGVDIATQCTKCLPEFWSRNINRYGCRACNCVLNNTVNHNSSVCNSTSGQCMCKTYVGGRQCERCDDNYYNTSHGCRECPECYGLIQIQVEILKRGIMELETMVERLLTRFESIGNRKFARRLNYARMNISRIFDKANSTANQAFRDLNNTLSRLGDLSSGVTNVTVDTNTLKRQQRKLEGTIKNITSWIETAYFLLKDANFSLPLVGNLMNRIEYFVIQMENSLNNSNRLNETQFEISGNVVINSKSRLSKIESVVAHAQTSRSNLTELTKSVLNLQNETDVITDHGEIAQYMSKNYSKSAENIMDISQDLFETVKKLTELIEMNKNLSRTIHVYNLSVANRAVEEDTSSSVKETETVVAQANQTFTSSSALLADARHVQHEARLANESAKTTLHDATKTLSILKQFQNRSENAERIAKDSLKNISTTDASSQKSIENIRNVSESIEEALNSSYDAVNLARKAYDISKTENQNITSIYKRSKLLEEKQERSRCSHDWMKNYQQNVTHRFNNLASVRSCPSHEANNASELVSAAVSRSSKTKKDATNVNRSVSDVHREVLKVEDAVKDLQTVQTSKSLQRKIQLYNDSFDRLREVLTQVRNARDEHTTFIEKLRAKVRALKSEVTDLEGLRDSLRDIPPCGVA